MLKINNLKSFLNQSDDFKDKNSNNCKTSNNNSTMKTKFNYTFSFIHLMNNFFTFMNSRINHFILKNLLII